MSLYLEFEQAVLEMDNLINEGFFGETAKKLMLQRDQQSIDEHLYNSFIDWVNDKNQFGKKEVAHLIMIFLMLYVESFQKKNQETIDILTSVWKGTLDQPFLECMSSYTELLRTHVEFKNLIKEFGNNQTLTSSQKKKLGGSLINAYCNGVEFINKVLVRLLALLKISKGELYEITTLSEMTLYKKTELFLSLSEGHYDILITSLDRDIRNAASHLNLYYNSNENVFIIKSTENKGRKGKTRKVKFEIMILKIYPFIGWFCQAFIYSGTLFVLAHENIEMFKLCFETVNKIGQSVEMHNEA